MSGVARKHAVEAPSVRAPASGRRSGPQQLRVAYVWRNEVMDDTLVPIGDSVRLGSTAKSTFAIPKLGLPPDFAILRPGARGYVLTLGTGMTGRVQLGGDEKEVDDFVRRGGDGAEGTEGAFRATPISTGDWGVIELDGTGDHNFFFQFVPMEPPLPPRPWSMDDILAPALAFAILLHAIFLTVTFILKDDANQFVFPGNRDLMTAYLVKRPPPEEVKKKEKKKEDTTGGNKKAKKKVKKPAATKGKAGKAGGKGKKRETAPTLAKGDPDKKAPEVAFLKKENREILRGVLDTDDDQDDILKKYRNATKKGRYAKGDRGHGNGSGTGFGDDKDGTGNTRGGKRGGAGGGGKSSDEIASRKGMDHGGERAGRGTGAGGGNERELSLKRGNATGDFSGLSKADVDKVIKRAARQIRACYQREANRDPRLAGKLQVRFTIRDKGGAGVVTKAKVAGGASTLRNAKVQNCVVRKIKALRFPAKGGARVNYPFIFTQQ